MTIRLWTSQATCVGALLVAGTASLMAQQPPQLFGEHPAIGAWFGKAVQVCVPGDNTCPKVALFMTPTLTVSGQFLGNDSLALGGPPFGPHTTAHGKWIATSNTDIIADYVFMLPGSTAATITALRFRWQASVIRWDTMVGYVNIFFGPELPATWESTVAGQYPTLPPEATPTLTPPAKFYTDPLVCGGGPPACPLIFRFTIKRVAP